jgi:hypothetical protein
MILPAPMFPPMLGEDAGQRIDRVVRAYAGCSLSIRTKDLAALVGRGVDDEDMVNWNTNCLTFALGVIAACGSDVAELRQHIPNGREYVALSPLVKRAGGWALYLTGQSVKTGSLMHYRSVPYRVNAAGETVYDDHYEFKLSGADEHGGGGRANNEITVEHGDWSRSVGKPLYEILDPDGYGLPDLSEAT